MSSEKLKRINYVTHDAWWNSDLPLLPKINKYFSINVFVFSSSYYDKHFKIKQSMYVENIYEYERKYRLKNIKSAYPALQFYKCVSSKSKKEDVLFYVFGDDPYFNLFLLLFSKSNQTIISFHNYHSHSDSPFFEKLFKQFFLRKFKNFHFQSKHQYDEFCLKYTSKNAFFTEMPSKDFGAPGNKISITRSNKRTFLFFGYIRDYKRVELFIDAANNTEVDAHFVIAGNCTNWPQYNDLIIDKKKFTCIIKFIDNADIPDYFTQADFLVLPYSDATQSGPLHIANNYNLPVIASDLQGFTELIKDGYNGFIFKKGDTKDLARCINAACRLSNEQYLKLKETQKEMQDQYSLNAEGIGDKFKIFIDRISAKK